MKKVAGALILFAIFFVLFSSTAAKVGLGEALLEWAAAIITAGLLALAVYWLAE